MKIIIIEDEKISANYLAALIKESEPNAEIVTTISSVKTGIEYFQDNPAPDLIFSDIQLGDGLSFEIFREVNVLTPIIFCTAYDDYAINAFETNSIAYIVKPFTLGSIKDAFKKYKDLQKMLLPNDAQYRAIMGILQKNENQVSSSVLVYIKDKIKPVKLDDIAMFYIENGITYLTTFDNQNYTTNKTLEVLEQTIGTNFFRVNRQFIINRKSIIEAAQYFGRRISLHLKVPYKEKIIVSKGNVAKFLNWLEYSE
ncbi:LytTR family DNA-binding domain-containing protein [Draconibacterium sp. IB214405]|uniref:LytR/AlgR family response regulator transcription factor n=1 Tax=Draconibacterium sp. IB214405 TaxID=3097352 RepID=UPI002A0BB25C|nr:LytTR family DNA-binding domain-containing protein [Draconibacterium sp. IB214405]MDX8341146.1 LytTR family DNA-binding domain-containing protein [Draconibacterium sp. IB214405]